jgi:DNA-binding beta-propeller fold protein YncE
MNRTMRRFATLFLGLTAVARFATAQPISAPPEGERGRPIEEIVPVDNQKGRYVAFEVGQLQPLLLTRDGAGLVAINQPGNRLALLDPTTLQIQLEIPIGMGGASVAERPGTDELWLVDRVQGCVSVISRAQGSIVRTIAVGAEPHGIAFSPSGDRAWITCSAVDRVDVIRTSDYSVRAHIAIPAREPRGIVYMNGRVWVTSFLSGNNTAGMGTLADPLHVTEVRDVQGAGLTPLPDRDLFAIQPGATPAEDALDPSATVTGLGTILFNLHARPGTSELWIPNTEALNAANKGEKSFVGGQVVSNRITVVDVVQHTTRIFDLDALAPANVKCAQPTGLAFDPVRARVYVCGYGSDLVAVFDIVGSNRLAWHGYVNLPPKQAYPRGTAPRTCVVSSDGASLYTFNRNDASIARIALGTLPASAPFAVDSPLPMSFGFSAGSNEEVLGRHLFTDARNSKSQTSSCASCHVDGHTDAVLWDLSNYLDPEGTPADQVSFGLDVKGPLVTQSMRRMEESGPYHWRGEKRSINDFNASFIGLLEHQDAQGNPANIGPEYQYLRHFVNRLAWPANPAENKDRTLTPEQVEGALLFQTKPVLGSLTCAACHTLPLGTRGEVTAEFADGVIRSADVPQLRGVGTKAGTPHVIGGAFGTRTELGTGLSHAGAYPTLADVVMRDDAQHMGQQNFQLTPLEAQKIAAFLAVFDTGLAPATAYQATAYPGNAATFGVKELAYLEAQADRGNCDVVVFRTPPPHTSPHVFARTGMYDTRTHKFQLASASQPEVDAAALLAEAASGLPVTFVGMPLGMGLSHGLDRDMDGLYDVDEIALGTNPDDPDTDGDHFIDGYEVQNGSDPFVADASMPQDTTPPALAAPVRLVYATSNTLKIEFRTSEMCRVHVHLNGGPAVQRVPLDHRADTEHWVVLNELEPNTTYQIGLEMRDPALNIATDTTAVFTTLPRSTAVPVAIDSIQLGLQFTATVNLLALVQLTSGGVPVGAGYTVHADVYRVPLSGGVSLVAADAFAPSAASGIAGIRVPLSNAAGNPSTYYFVVKSIDSPPGGLPYVNAYDKETFDKLVY